MPGEGPDTPGLQGLWDMITLLMQLRTDCRNWRNTQECHLMWLNDRPSGFMEGPHCPSSWLLPWEVLKRQLAEWGGTLGGDVPSLGALPVLKLSPSPGVRVLHMAHFVFCDNFFGIKLLISISINIYKKKLIHQLSASVFSVMAHLVCSLHVDQTVNIIAYKVVVKLSKCLKWSLNLHF